MESFNVILKPSAERELRKLPRKLVPRAVQLMDGRKSDPFGPPARKLSGHERMYRLRVGDYRIVYEVDIEARQVTVQYIRHRRDVYRNL